jgi:hypothetical protein
MVHPTLDIEHSLDTDPTFSVLGKPQKRLTAEFERLVASFDVTAAEDSATVSPAKRVTYDAAWQDMSLQSVKALEQSMDRPSACACALPRRRIRPIGLHDHVQCVVTVLRSCAISRSG